MSDLRDLRFIRAQKHESARPVLEHGIIASTPASVNDPVHVILPEFANDQVWGPYRWVRNGADMPQEGDDCLIAFSNRREGWIVCYWSGSYTPPVGSVISVFGRAGVVVAAPGDYSVSQVTGAAPLASPSFSGAPTAPTPLTADNSTAVATTAYVKAQGYLTSVPVSSVFGRTGAVVATSGDYSVAQVTGAAPLASPGFTGSPTAPTPLTADNSTSIATTAFVKAQGYLTANAVSSVFGRTGAVVATTGDYTVSQVTGAAPLASPTFTGTPSAPTPLTSDNTTKIATTAFVKAQGYLTANAVTSVFGRTGAVVAASGDYAVAQVTGAAPLASPTFTGTPAAPTATVDTSTTQVATTAFVLGQLSAVGDGTPAMDGTAARGTSTHNARADHVHPTDTSRAPLASPTFTGTPAAPTPLAGDNSTKVATTAYVQTAISGLSGAVVSVFGRTGAVVAASGDYAVAQVTGAAPLASPTFTGTAAAPTPLTADNSTTIATTAYVKAQGYLASALTSFNGRATAAAVPTTGDYTAAMVTNAADKSSASAQAFSGALTTTKQAISGEQTALSQASAITPNFNAGNFYYGEWTGGLTMTLANPTNGPGSGFSGLMCILIRNQRGANITAISYGTAYKGGPPSITVPNNDYIQLLFWYSGTTGYFVFVAGGGGVGGVFA